MLRNTASAAAEIAVTTEAPKQKSRFTPEMFEGKDYYTQAVRAFLCDRPELLSKSSQFRIVKGQLFWVRKSIDGERTHRSIVAKRINGEIFCNSSSIGAHRKDRSGRRHQLRGRMKIQEELGRYVPSIPFSVFKDSKLDMNVLEVLDRGPEEEIDLNRRDKNGKKVLDHYTGAMLFRLEKSYFLFDIDRNDLALHQFNAFLSKLSKPAKTIAQAYDDLKPIEVMEAEKFIGTACPRQGEWFFIPQNKKCKAKPGENAILQSKGNRAHYVEQLSEEGYVQGKVTHGGYEHKPITLKGWHKPVPNTAIESFKITGQVD